MLTQCKVDPMTGTFWTSFEALTKYSVVINTQQVKNESRFPHFKRGDKTTHLKVVHTISKQATRGRGGHNGSGHRGGRGGV